MKNLFKNEDVAIIGSDEFIKFMSEDGEIYTIDLNDKDFEEKFDSMMGDPKMHLLFD